MRKLEQSPVKEYIQTVFVMFGCGSFLMRVNVTFILVFFLIKMPIITWEIMKLKVIYE